MLLRCCCVGGTGGDAEDRLAEVDTSASASAMKNQVVGLIAAVAYLRGPLIVLNTLTCIVEILV